MIRGAGLSDASRYSPTYGAASPGVTVSGKVGVTSIGMLTLRLPQRISSVAPVTSIVGKLQVSLAVRVPTGPSVGHESAGRGRDAGCERGRPADRGRGSMVPIRAATSRRNTSPPAPPAANSHRSAHFQRGCIRPRPASRRDPTARCTEQRGAASNLGPRVGHGELRSVDRLCDHSPYRSG